MNGTSVNAKLTPVTKVTSMQAPKYHDIYRHWKGGIYRVIPPPKDSDTGSHIAPTDTFVWYQNVVDHQVWRRTTQDFLGTVRTLKGNEPRFVLSEKAPGAV